MNEYVNSLEDIEEIKRINNEESLTKQEMKLYRKFINCNVT